jgi:hypothetical protein
MDFQVALDVVYDALNVVNSIRPAEDAVSRSPDVVLAGDGGCLDSLGLVTMTLSIERRVAEITGQDISLFNDDDFESQLASLRTPSTIAQLILEKLSDDKNHGRLGLQR